MKDIFNNGESIELARNVIDYHCDAFSKYKKVPDERMELVEIRFDPSFVLGFLTFLSANDEEREMVATQIKWSFDEFHLTLDTVCDEITYQINEKLENC